MTTEEGKTAEIPNDQNFAHYYYSLPKCESNIIRLFNRNEYYTVHGVNAEYLANSFLNTTQSLVNIKTFDKDLPSVIISQARYQSLLRHLLIDNSFGVEIYSRSKKRLEWSLETKASPGSLGALEDILYNHNIPVLNQSTVAINVTPDNKVYFAAIDSFECAIYLDSFDDDASFTMLESLFVRFNPKECILPQKGSNSRITMILKKNDIFHSEYKSVSTSNDSLDDIECYLKKFVKTEYYSVLVEIVQHSRLALVPFKAILNHLNLLKDSFAYSKYSLKKIDSVKYVRLDLSSIANLHLFPTEANNKSIHSLYQLLNHCKTVSGKKLLIKFIRQPLTDQKLIEQRLDLVEYFINNSLISSNIHDNNIAHITDITRVYKKFTNNRCKIKDIYNVYQAVLKMSKVLSVLKQNELTESMKICFVDVLQKILDNLENFNKLVNDTIIVVSGELLINYNLDEELSALFNKFKELHSLATEEHDKICTNLYRKFKMERDAIKLEKDKSSYYVRVSKQHSSSILKCKEYEQVKTGSAKDSRFISKELKNLNEQLIDITAEYDKLQSKYIEIFVNDCREYSDYIQQFESIVAFLDAIISLAKAARSSAVPYSRPTILPQGSDKLKLIQFRHPIIELRKTMSYVPNNIEFDQHKFFVITGPNMGGKSTLIRSVALCVLMAQIGSFVPCDEAVISIVDGIYTRISVNDNPLMGLSTFMSEMVETSAILRSVTANSLVVIDELGRSTSTYDGFGIAQGITEYLANNVKAFVLFATHFHEMGRNFSSVGQLRMKVSFQDGKCVIHYIAEPGTAYQSFGIELAQSVNMPEHILRNAKRKLEEVENSFTDQKTVLKVIQLLRDQCEQLTESKIEQFLKELDVRSLN